MAEQYFGYDPRREEFDDGPQLHEWVGNIGSGVMGIEDLPEECYHFIGEQFARFGIPYPKEIEEVGLIGSQATIHVVDTLDPYALLFDTSDVQHTHDWAHHAYTIRFPERLGGHGYPSEVEPGNIETFQFLPGRDIELFNQFMSMPGLEALPNGTGHMINDLLTGEFNNMEALAALDLHSELALRELCAGPDGHVSYEKMLAYFQLAAWATFVWIAGPYGRELRYKYHEIFRVASKYGECLLTDGMVVDPDHYTKESRPPRSCFKCGISAWCVEPTAIMGNAYNICEHCSHDGQRLHEIATCGSRICIMAECPRHPYHHMGGAGIHRAAQQRGMLQQAASGPSRPLTLGQAIPAERKLLK